MSLSRYPPPLAANLRFIWLRQLRQLFENSLHHHHSYKRQKKTTTTPPDCCLLSSHTLILYCLRITRRAVSREPETYLTLGTRIKDFRFNYWRRTRNNLPIRSPSLRRRFVNILCPSKHPAIIIDSLYRAGRDIISTQQYIRRRPTENAVAILI